MAEPARICGQACVQSLGSYGIGCVSKKSCRFVNQSAIGFGSGGDEGMGEYLLQCGPLGGVGVEHAAHQVLGTGGQHHGQPVV